MSIALNRFRLFAHQHDDIPAFHAAYLVTTFLMAAIFSLGYFVLLIVLHMVLDYVKYRDYFHFPLLLTLRSVLLESLADIALVLLSLTFAVYLSHDFALFAVSGILRSQLTVLRFLGTIVPKIYIIEHMITLALSFHSYLYSPHPEIRTPLSRVHRYCVYSIVVTLSLLALSLWVYRGNEDLLLSIVAREMTLRL